IALPPFEVKSFSIDAAEPLSSAVSTTTLAPAARHACACAFCFCGSFNAFVIEYVTPAALSALAKSGASNCTQRTDDFVSGNRTQTWTLAFFEPTLAPAPDVTSAATAARARSRKIDLLEIFFTADLLLLRGLTLHIERAGIWTARRISTHNAPPSEAVRQGRTGNSR